jgi:hypothetical protein
MSHNATNWAIRQRGIKPSSKLVLWHLCDRFHPDHGCFPSQETLANDCEMSRATVNRCIDELVAAKLVTRHPRINQKTKKQDSTEYTFSFQETVSQNATRKPDPVSQNDEEPCLKNDDSRVSNCDTNPVREPVIEPVTRDCANDLFSADDQTTHPEQPKAKKPDRLQTDFDEFWQIYPRKAEPDAAFKNYKKARKESDRESLLRAAQVYAGQVEREKTETKFTKLAKNWLSSGAWRDLGSQSSENYNFDDLNMHAQNALRDGRIPPSMAKTPEGMAEARYHLKKLGKVPA